MIINIERDCHDFLLDELNTPAYKWESIGIKANEIWWRITRRANHSSTPETYFVKESHGDYTAVYYKRKGVA